MSNLKTEDLYQFVYISRITSLGLSNINTLDNISEISVDNNDQANITGVLCYGNGYFFQYLEGSEQALTNLKNRLLMDDRHKDIHSLEFDSISQRYFNDWSLCTIILERWMVNDPKAKALMPFKPYEWAPEEWRSFLKILRGYYKEQEKAGDTDAKPIQYNRLATTLNKVVGEHQAFFLIQTILGTLIILALLWFMLSDKF